MGPALRAFRAAGTARRGVACVNRREILHDKFTMLVRSLGRAVRNKWL